MSRVACRTYVLCGKVEVKRPKNGLIPRGRVSKNQTEMMDRLTDNGAECAVVYCVADVIEKFIDWGIGH